MISFSNIAQYCDKIRSDSISSLSLSIKIGVESAINIIVFYYISCTMVYYIVYSILQVLLAMTAALLLVWPALHFEDNAEVGNIPSSLSWDQFQAHCPKVESEAQTDLSAHLRCSQVWFLQFALLCECQWKIFNSPISIQ